MKTCALESSALNLERRIPTLRHTALQEYSKAVFLTDEHNHTNQQQGRHDAS